MTIKVLVVGGNGFLGSAITKQALQRGWKVVSLSASGRPFVTPAGHRPAWSSSSDVQWQRGDALDPRTYQHLLPECDAVVHSVGILLESDYKGKKAAAAAAAAEDAQSERAGNSGPGFASTLRGIVQGWAQEAGIGGSNPLKRGVGSHSYESVNRDSALSVAKAFAQSRAPISATPHAPASPFVYISAEDIFRPLVPSRYITTKRQAEAGIATVAAGLDVPHFEGQVVPRPLPPPSPQDVLRPIFLRPGLMYHPHTRPLSTLPAALLDASATFHEWKPRSFLRMLPTPANVLRSLPLPHGHDLGALARLLEVSPLHVDTVARATCEAIARSELRGAWETDGIKWLAGFRDVAPSPPPTTGAGQGGWQGEAGAPSSTSAPWPTQRVAPSER